MSPLLRFYLFATHFTGPLWRMAHRRRLAKGKEVAERLPEKYGVAPASRPEGEVLWFHALSVGESLALVPLIERALEARQDAHVILTTSTATSIPALERAGLPGRARHVMLPIDTPRATRAFLDHWRPSLAAFAELDFWPRLMVEAKRRGIPMALVNSRLPEGNFESRGRMGGMMADILRLFDLMLVQDTASFERFKALGADPKRMRVVGPLKAAARPLPTDGDTFRAVREAVGARPVWLAAATHGSEHGALIEAQGRVRQAWDDALLIVAPRHVADGEAVERLAREAGMAVARRSRGEKPSPDVDVYIADTIGEMGIWYRVAPVSFVGHSLDLTGAGLDGKNPFEAAALGSAILHGPAVEYFRESYDRLTAAGAAREVRSVEELAVAVSELLEPEARRIMLDGAERVVRQGRAVVENSWVSLATLI